MIELTKDLLWCLYDGHNCECGCEFSILNRDSNMEIDGKAIVEQILKNQATITKINAALDIYKEKEFSREFVRHLIQ